LKIHRLITADIHVVNEVRMLKAFFFFSFFHLRVRALWRLATPVFRSFLVWKYAAPYIYMYTVHARTKITERRRSGCVYTYIRMYRVVPYLYGTCTTWSDRRRYNSTALSGIKSGFDVRRTSEKCSNRSVFPSFAFDADSVTRYAGSGYSAHRFGRKETV